MLRRWPYISVTTVEDASAVLQLLAASSWSLVMEGVESRSSWISGATFCARQVMTQSRAG
jgi:hypothetical protein